MNHRNKLISAIMVIVGLTNACHSQATKWPTAVTSSIWIPHNANNIRYLEKKNSYRISFVLETCYPALDSVDKIKSEMSVRSFKQLEYDFLNPTHKTNSAQVPPEWSYF